MADISSITLPGGGTYDLKDKNAQRKITISGILKSDGQGGVSAAVAGTDYQAPLAIDATPTANSTNPVQSGGVYTDVRTRVPVYGKGVNLLRNWYFVGGGTGRGVFPVNQRGRRSYTASSSAKFGPDAWKVYYGSILSLTAVGAKLSNGGVVVTDLQRNDSLWGRKVTLSVLTSGGIYKASGTMPSSAPASQTNVLIISNSALQFEYRIYANSGITSIAWRSYDSSLTYYAMKLEVGTEQTLCHNEGTAENPVWVLNEIPDYEYELYRCITSTADPSDTYANKSLATEQQLAYVETGTTASRNYTAGQYISLNGLLYTADTAIASGATFYTSGGNKNLTECVGGGFNNQLKVKEFTFTTATLGTNFSPTSRAIGTTQNLFGIDATHICSIFCRDNTLTPSANMTFGIWGGTLYMAATQSCTLSDSLPIRIVVTYY